MHTRLRANLLAGFSTPQTGGTPWRMPDTRACCWSWSCSRRWNRAGRWAGCRARGLRRRWSRTVTTPGKGGAGPVRRCRQLARRAPRCNAGATRRAVRCVAALHLGSWRQGTAAGGAALRCVPLSCCGGEGSSSTRTLSMLPAPTPPVCRTQGHAALPGHLWLPRGWRQRRRGRQQKHAGRGLAHGY